MRPLIGIPLCVDGRGRWKPGRLYQYVDAAYAQAVEAAGGIPVHLPLQADTESLASRVQGLLLPGGDDFLPPAPYPPAVHFDAAPAEQLAFDDALLAAARKRELPVLAICYGMQLLVRQQGGALIYDIPSDLPQADAHHLPEAGARHPIRIDRDTRLAACLGLEEDRVNSLHHQGVADPGAGLRVCARAPDDLIEAVEDEGPGFCIGVQWHPEKLGGAHQQRLFSAFIAACISV